MLPGTLFSLTGYISRVKTKFSFLKYFSRKYETMIAGKGKNEFTKH
jgi:hypothetical protein